MAGRLWIGAVCPHTVTDFKRREDPAAELREDTIEHA